MSPLLDIFGYLSVVLKGLELTAQTILIGSIFYLLFIARPLETGTRRDIYRTPESRRVVLLAALVFTVLVIVSTALNAGVLAWSLDTSVAQISGATFVVAGAVKVLAAVLIVSVITLHPALVWWTRVVVIAAALTVLCAALATSHAVARLADPQTLLLATAMHELGAALWLGGLPCLWLALGRRFSARQAQWIAMRYSPNAIAGVLLIAIGAVAFAAIYIGSVQAAYGTAYGAMAVAKTVLFCMLLLLGLANFRAVRRFASDAQARHRTRRFVEVEMGIGFAVLMAAGSITSLPPAADLVDDRLALSDITARLSPRWPRFQSPEHASLAVAALQTRIDAEAGHNASRLKAFEPGGGERAPRNANDRAWSEYNHHWAGLFVALMGLVVMAGRGRRDSWTRHWPLLFVLLAAFLVFRADPEVWPLGSLGLIETLKDPEVVQHRLFEALIVGFAFFEWGVSTGRIKRHSLERVFPLLVALSGTLLLTHSHSLGNVKEELLIELTHLPIAVLGIAAGWACWLEVEAPAQEGRWAGWVWPACFVLIGLLLMLYREG